ncbi:hypothetical protein EMIT093MI4_130078 [Pseudomonas sp. IT-93MI4]
MGQRRGRCGHGGGPLKGILLLLWHCFQNQHRSKLWERACSRKRYIRHIYID